MSRSGRRLLLSVCAAVVGLHLVACSADSEPGPQPPVTAAPSLPGWEARSTLNVPRDDFATAVVGEEIWVFGGMSGDRGTRLDTIEIYDVVDDRWRLFDGVMPEGIASFEAAAIGTKVFLFGGLDRRTEASDFSMVLDTATGEWRKLPPMPIPRYAHTVTLHDGLIYLIGGESSEGTVGEVDVFNPRTEAWSKGDAMPSARGSHDAVSAGDAIYVIGGWLDGGPTDLVQVYDPARGRWSEAEPLPEPVSRAGAAVVDGELWVSYHRFSAALDLAEGTWSSTSPLSVSRHGLGYVAVGGTIYGIGGCTETPLRDVRTVDALTLS